MKKRDVGCIFRKLRLEIHNSHHKMAYFVHEGKRILKTRLSHGDGELSPAIVWCICKQLHLTHTQLAELFACHFGYDDYVVHLKRGGLLD